MCRRPQQQEGSGQPAEHTGGNERNQDAPGDIQVAAVRTATCRHTNPQGDRIGGIRRNGRNSREEQCRECDEAPAAGDGVECAAECSGEEEEDGGLQVQELRFTRNSISLSAVFGANVSPLGSSKEDGG